MTASRSIQLCEWEVRSPGTDAGRVLEGMALSGDGCRRLADSLAATRVLYVRELRSGLEIEATSFVGRVRIGDLTVTIMPKIAGPLLLQLFAYAYDLPRLPRHAPTSFDATGALFLDLLITRLHDEAEALVRRGLPRRYQPREESLTSPRGRIDVDRLAAQGGISIGTLPCRHHLRMEDWLLPQILVAGLHLGADLTSIPDLRWKLRRLAGSLCERVSPIELHTRLLDRAKDSLNRLVASYAPVLALITVLHEGRVLSLDTEGHELLLPGFLFDMNRFFQAVLARFLREHLVECEVHDEEALGDLMQYAPAANPRKVRAPRPRPDFMVRRKGQTVAILDAKYRDLWRFPLPREMLYQLAIYALSQPTGASATILYPTMASDARDARIELRDPMGSWGRGYVVLRPVILPRLGEPCLSRCAA